MTPSLLLSSVWVDDRLVDVRITGGRVAAIGPALRRSAGEEVLDGRGGALLPGLVDHHLHLHALAAAQASVRCGPPDVGDAATLTAALAAAPADRHGWVRGVGYTDTVAGVLDAPALDALHAARPVRVQHRSGALWMLNTAAVRRLELHDAQHPGIERGPDDAPTGRVWRADAWLRTRLPRERPPELGAVGEQLLSRGVTAVTDATPDLTQDAIASVRAAVAGGALPQRVHLLGVPLGTHVVEPRVSTGPYKIVLADSDLPTLPDLTERIRAAHGAGRAVAVHCVTREALLLLLAALDEAGSRPGDRIEHAALVPDETRTALARRGLAVVTQPGFLADRGDGYLSEVDPADLPDLYRCATLQAAGVPLALSSDAPYGPVDPWTVLRAAVDRRARSGATLGPAERLTAAAALAAMLADPADPGGLPRRVVPGAPADLVLLHVPVHQLPTADDPVRAVVLGGRVRRGR